MDNENRKKNTDIVRYAVIGLLTAVSLFVIVKMVLAAFLTDTPREYRDYANVQFTYDVLNGVNPYAFTEDITWQHVYVYTPLTSMIVAGLHVLCGVNIVRLHYVVTLVFLLLSSCLVSIYIYKKYRNMELAVFAFLLMLGSNYHAGFMGAAPGPLGVFIISLVFILLDRKEKYSFADMLCVSFLSVLSFFVKQYFAVCALSVFIFLLIKNKKNAIQYVLSCAVIGLASLYILDHFCPLFVFDTVYLFYSSTKGMVDSMSMYLISLKKIVYFGVCYFPLFLVWAAQLLKKIRSKELFKNISVCDINTIMMLLILFFWLGKNNGSFITYHTQILLPGLVMAAADASAYFLDDLKDKKSMIFSLSRAAAAVFITAVIFIKGWYPETLNAKEIADWEYLYSRLDEYSGNYDDIVIISPVPGYYAMEHGLNDIDNGHNYLGEIEYDDSSVTKLLKAMGLLDDLDLIYETALERTDVIQERIDNGDYKAIFITENEGYAKVNKDLYELKDEMHLTTGTEASEINIYELKSEVTR